jgi:hypothetical protein
MDLLAAERNTELLERSGLSMVRILTWPSDRLPWPAIR